MSQPPEREATRETAVEPLLKIGERWFWYAVHGGNNAVDSRFNLGEAMKTLERMDESVRPTDALTELQLRIARRADELARACGRTMSDWECWIEAEREVLDEAEGVARRASP